MIRQMYGGKREPGTRVAVLKEGFYVPVSLESSRNDSHGNEYFTVKFAGGDKDEYKAADIVGNGFKSINDIKLRQNQKAYTTYKGREVRCEVVAHTGGLVKLILPDVLGEGSPIVKLDDEVRIVKDSNSPRPQDHIHEPDYRKIASVNSSPNHGKNMPVSANIEVPSSSRTRKSSSEPVMDELMAALILSELSSSPVFYKPKGVSPHSFGSSGVGSWGQENQMSPSHKDLYVGHSVDTPERSKSVIQHTDSIEHSPSSTGDPIEVDSFGGSDTKMTVDDDFSTHGNVVPPGHSTPAPFISGSPNLRDGNTASPSQNPSSLVNPGVKLESVKEEPNGKEDRPHSVPSYTQTPYFFVPSFTHSMRNEEYMPNKLHDFGSIQQQSQFSTDARVGSPSSRYLCLGTPPNFYAFPFAFGTSSPLSRPYTGISVQQSEFPHATDPVGYSDNKHRHPSSHPIRISGASTNRNAQPINIPRMKPFSWHDIGRPSPSLSPKPSLVRQRQMHQATSPKMGYHSSRKFRGDGKKCRKVYGMEHRDMWCTACRWKKACQRFPD